MSAQLTWSGMSDALMFNVQLHWHARARVSERGRICSYLT